MSRATQAGLLDQRITENRLSQTIDLAEWIFERVRINPSDQILEMCCGTGGQTIPMLSRLGTAGTLFALDVSGEALQTLTSKVGVGDRNKLITLQGGLDELPSTLERSGRERPAFDLIFCAYGLYYSQDSEKTLNDVYAWMKPGGRIVVVGPFGPNNKPLFDLLEAGGVKFSDAVTSSSGPFMTQTVVPWAALQFESVRVSTMVNLVRWPNAERVLNYWQNTTFYDEQRRGAVEALLERHFSEHEEFVNEKWVMMVEMQDARS